MAFGFEIGRLKENLNLLVFLNRVFTFLLCVGLLVGKAGRGVLITFPPFPLGHVLLFRARWFCGCLIKNGVTLFLPPMPHLSYGMAPCSVQRTLSCLR